MCAHFESTSKPGFCSNHLLKYFRGGALAPVIYNEKQWFTTIQKKNLMIFTSKTRSMTIPSCPYPCVLRIHFPRQWDSVNQVYLDLVFSSFGHVTRWAPYPDLPAPPCNWDVNPTIYPDPFCSEPRHRTICCRLLNLPLALAVTLQLDKR